jgi:hypothetical protein
VDGYDSDREEVDLLVRELAAKKPGAPKAPFVQSVVSPRVDVRRATGWTRPAISLPEVPDLNRFFRMPGPATIARMWVALGVLSSAAMTFWPYPKTYLWGMVLYLLSLGLVLVAGVWGARLSWYARLGAAHTVALGTVLWAVVLATETVPPI